MIREETRPHSRLLKCGLQIEECRAYWARAGGEVSARRAFEDYWFGAKSMARVEVLLTNLRHRFDAFPPTLQILGRWGEMSPDTRKLICHWHLQLADPLYRRFTGVYLVQRREGPRAEVTRDLVARWVEDEGPAAWTLPTRIEFAGKLLSAARAAGLVETNRDPRPLALPLVEDLALEYALHLLREVEIEGSLLQNPYLASVGLDGSFLEERLARLPSLRFSRQGGLVDFGWRFPSLEAWANAQLTNGENHLNGAAP